MTLTKIFSRCSGRSGVLRTINACLFALLFAASLFQVAPAQEQQPPPPTAMTTPAPPPVQPAAGPASDNSQADAAYRIGPGDLLDIRVFNRPQLSRDSVRVDGRGMIRMPLIAEEIQAACRTEGELAGEIATRYLKYQRNPQVDVFIKDYRSQPVAVIGAVNAPGRFQLQRRMRLLELLTFVGGPGPRAGRTVQIVHAATAFTCDGPTIINAPQPGAATAAAETSPVGESVVSYKLRDTLLGKDESNPYVRPGDIISLPEAEQAFILGNVLRPAPIQLTEPITVSRAIAMAGGTLPDTNMSRVRITRQAPGSTTKTELYVDLKAVNKLRAEDVMLQGGDVVEVPTSTGFQKVLKGLAGMIVPTIMSLPVRAVP